VKAGLTEICSLKLRWRLADCVESGQPEAGGGYGQPG